jgi:hypothetical protein
MSYRPYSTPEAWEIARGNISGKSPVHVLGDNHASSTSRETLWEGSTSNQIVFPSSGIQMEIVSSDGNDAASGTGVRTVVINYLDASHAEQTETITMNGTTPVNTTATNIFRIQSIHSATVGSGAVAAGAITLEDTSSAVEYTRIRAGLNKSLTGAWTVPAGKTLFITEWEAGSVSTTANRTSEITLEATSDLDGTLLSGIFIVKDVLHVQVGEATTFFDPPLKIAAKADVVMVVISSGAMECSGSFEGWIE